MARPTRRPAIQRAINVSGGTQSAFAEMLGVSQSLVTHWLNGRKAITAERALQIEQATGGAVKRAELRPDLWG